MKAVFSDRQKSYFSWSVRSGIVLFPDMSFRPSAGVGSAVLGYCTSFRFFFTFYRSTCRAIATLAGSAFSVSPLKGTVQQYKICMPVRDKAERFAPTGVLWYVAQKLYRHKTGTHEKIGTRHKGVHQLAYFDNDMQDRVGKRVILAGLSCST